MRNLIEFPIKIYYMIYNSSITVVAFTEIVNQDINPNMYVGCKGKKFLVKFISVVEPF